MVYMTGGKEGCGVFEGMDDLCPACKKPLTKEIEKKEKGGFRYILKCPKHGIMKRREPTYSEARIFNE